MTSESTSARHLMIFDGECAFCRRCVGYARAIDKHGRFDFQPFQSARHPLLTPPVRAQCERAIHVITRGGRIFRGGSACFFLLEAASDNKLVKRAARLMRSFPLVVPVEIGYWIVARNRGLFSKFF